MEKSTNIIIGDNIDNGHQPIWVDGHNKKNMEAKKVIVEDKELFPDGMGITMMVKDGVLVYENNMDTDEQLAVFMTTVCFNKEALDFFAKMDKALSFASDILKVINKFKK